MFKRLRIRTKILIAFIIVAVVAVGIIGFFAFTVGSNTLEEESFNKLTAVREMKANQVEDYFQLIVDQVISLSKNRMIVDAMTGFDAGLHLIEDELEINDEQMAVIDAELTTYYEQEFLPRLALNEQDEVLLEDYWPADERTRVMQNLYIANNPYEVGAKQLLDNPMDGSSYSENHKLFHPIIRDFLERFGYYDIFLVDAKTDGHIAYSVFKEVDYGTSLVTGPYAETNFAKAYRAAREATDEDFVALVDYDPYNPSYGAPAAFVASPIFDGQEKIGVLIFQMPVDRINGIMTNNQKWSDVGLGESGETYLVGDDFTMRNQSRFLIEDSEGYFKLIDEIGVPTSIIETIRNLNTTIGLQEVRTKGADAALNGETGQSIFPDYRGVPVLSAYRLLDIPGLKWAIMSEIDQAEAFASIRALGLRIGLGAMGLIILIVIGATLFSRSITKPIEDLQSQAGEISAGNLDTKIAVDTEDEINDLANTLETMRRSNRDLIIDLENINLNLENLVAERTAKLEASERRSNSIIEQSGDAIIVIDGEGKVLVWNTRAEQMFGYSAEEMAGEAMERIVPETYNQRHQEAFEQATELGHLKNPGVTHELSAKRNNGGEFPVELSISQWELGGHNYFSASIRDITERKQAELAIREREERIRSIVEIAPDAIISIDGQQNIIMFNSTAEEIFGYDVDEVLGQPLTMLMPEESRAIHGHEVEKFLAESASARSMDARREIFGRRKDGSVFPAEAGISKLELDGQIIFTAFFRDITERKRLEAQVADQLAFVRTLIDTVPNPIFAVGPDQRYTLFNKAYESAYGIEAADQLGKTVMDIETLSPEEREFYRDQNLELLANGGMIHDELDISFADGELHTILQWVTAFEQSDGSIGGLVGITADITEQKQLEAQIANQLAFVRSLVNTIPNPLFVKGVDTKFITFNSAYEGAFGIDGDDYVGRTVLDMAFLPEETRRAYQDEDSALLETGGEFSREVQLPFSDGRFHDVIYQVTTFDLPNGHRGGLMGLLTDISQIKELERELAIANERMSTELNFARDIQLSMLPLIFPAFPTRKEVSVYAALESAREVGGDFYDFYFLDDDHLCFVIGDVAGKGAPGALMMAVSKTLIKSRAADDSEPASILTHVNDELSQDNKSSMFVTVFLGVINVKTGELVYTNAGHNPPYIRRSDGSLEKVDAFHGPVIGAMPGLPYQQDSDTLRHGDTILLYTDGVTEAFNEEEELFSESRLEALLPHQSLDSAEKLVNGTIEKVNQFAGEAEQSDDVTLLAIQFLGLPEEMTSKELNITIKNRIKDMGIVDEEFDTFSADNQLADSVRQSVSIVLDEMLNNIISYAYQGEKEKEIEINVELSARRLVLTIKDAGVPFNPFSRETPDISDSIEERGIGGLGIHMVRSLMDEYSYQRQINKNVVTLVKLLDDEPSD